MEYTLSSSTPIQLPNDLDIIDRLDEEFRQILRVIKEQIPFITSNCHLTQYRLWLEKLSSSNMEKLERNMYLMELARQIQNNNLLPPFHQPPPQGSLKSLPKINHFCPSTVELRRNPNEIWPWDDPMVFGNNEHLFPIPPNPLPNEYIQSLQSLECTRNFPDFIHISEPNCHVAVGDKTRLNASSSSLQAVKMEMKATSKSLGKKKKLANKTKSVHQKLNVAAWGENFESRNSYLKEDCHSKQIHRCGEQFNLKKLENKIMKEDKKEKDKGLKDDSSWCDLTDVSATSLAPLGCGDVQQNNLNKPDEDLEQSTEEFLEIGGKEPGEIRDEHCKLETVDELEEDVTYKVPLKDTNFIPADWKKTIESLQIRLTETLNQNNELKSVIDVLQLKLEEDNANFKLELEKQKQTASNEKNNEIETLKTQQNDALNETEDMFKIKLREAEKLFQQNLDKQKSLHDAKIMEMKQEHSQLLKDKEKEIARLTNIIQQQCIRMANEVSELRVQIGKLFSHRKSNDEKIVVLQKCISKMDKLFQKSEIEYLESIEKLRQELELKEKASQIQLRSQRAELISRATVEKQEEIEAVITNLEVKYIQMLEQHEFHMAENKIRDEETIETLKRMLDEHGISYDID